MVQSVYLICIVCISIFYCYRIFILSRGWHKIKPFTPVLSSHDTLVSIVIPARNEADYVGALLDSLCAQTYPRHLLEIIVVNDHSIDNTEQIVRQPEYSGVKCIALQDTSGKKAALLKGIHEAHGTLIMTTDADCIVHEKWVETFAAYYELNKPKLLFGMVTFRERTLWDRLQALEFFSLTATAAGSVGMQRPVVSNAANMAFERDLFVKDTNDHFNISVASGDDMFLMLSQKRNNASAIHYVKSVDAVVTTMPQKTLSSFVSQRKRWLSKTKYVHDADVYITGSVIVLTNMSVIAAAVLAVISPAVFAQGFMVLFLIKTITDFLFLYPVVRFYGKAFLMGLLIPGEILYAVYSLCIFLISSFAARFAWKGRYYKIIVS